MQVSALDRDHNSVLHVAAYYGNAAAIQALLESGWHVDSLNKDRETPLHWAAQVLPMLILSRRAYPLCQTVYARRPDV